MMTVSALKMTTNRARWPNTQAVKLSSRAFISRNRKPGDTFVAEGQRCAVGRLGQLRDTGGQPGSPGHETPTVVPTDCEQSGLSGDNNDTVPQADRRREQ